MNNEREPVEESLGRRRSPFCGYFGRERARTENPFIAKNDFKKSRIASKRLR